MRRTTCPTLPIVIILITLFLVTSACRLVDRFSGEVPPARSTPADQLVQPATPVPVLPEETPLPPTATPVVESGPISMDLTGIASGMEIKTIEAVTANTGEPYWLVMPRHLEITLQGYAVSGSIKTPQVFIYPAAELENFSPAAGRAFKELEKLMQSRQAEESLPFLPLINEKQAMHAQVEFLDFQNGSGVRYLTQFDQSPHVVNNQELFYTFQGLTSDGQYYLAAVLPVTHPELPASAEQPADLNTYLNDLLDTVYWLDDQPASSFSPDLAKLDAMIQSIVVR